MDWLPISFRAEFKGLVFGPGYLQGLLPRYQPTQALGGWAEGALGKGG